MSVDVRNDHPSQRVGLQRLARHLRGVLRVLDRGRAHVDVRLVTDRAMRRLNRDWRGVDRATDVLSFALQEGGAPDLGPHGPVDLLGEIVVSLDAARRQARLVRESARQLGAAERAVRGYGVTLEAMFLATHGVLHLLGHDHVEAEQAEVMEQWERRLLADVTTLDIHAPDRSEHGVRTARIRHPETSPGRRDGSNSSAEGGLGAR